MKKLMSLLFCLTLLLTLSACGGGNKAGATDSNKSTKTEETQMMPKKTLVVYFSASGNTKAVASRLAEAAKADLLELVPTQPYTSDDLNYRIENCRSNNEQRDPKSRPAIAANLDNVGKYETILIGFPIWWGIEPRIIDTFIDKCPLDGKNVAIFATSGGSGIARSEKEIKAMCPKANWKGAKLFSTSLSAQEAQNWLTSLGIK